MDVVRVLAGVASDARQQAYATVENRAVVATHLRRERSPGQAKLAHARDGYRCRVCGVDFSELYGKLGVGFAEVHHRIALASPAARKDTRLEDLVTVCANCHRMLHCMKGRSTDVERLKKLFTSKWPTGSKKV